jgi:hypothetical protein
MKANLFEERIGIGLDTKVSTDHRRPADHRQHNQPKGLHWITFIKKI